MCQRVIDNKVYNFKKPTKMWKIVWRDNYYDGPFYRSVKERNSLWAKKEKIGISNSYGEKYGITSSGYHVFASRKGAEKWHNDQFMNLPNKKVVTQVLVKGRARKFITETKNIGYLVEQWRPLHDET